MFGFHKTSLVGRALFALAIVFLSGCEVGTQSAPKAPFRAPSSGNSGVTSTSSTPETGKSVTVVVTVKDKAGFGISGVTPTVTAVDSTGSSNGVTSTGCSSTDVHGSANCTISSSLPGVRTIKVLSPVQSTGSSITFFQVPRSIFFSTQPDCQGTATTGCRSNGDGVGKLSTMPKVTLLDAANQPVKTATTQNGAAFTNVTLSVLSGTGTFTGTKVLAPGAGTGIADFSGAGANNLSFDKATTYVLSATYADPVGGTLTATSNSFTVGSSAAATLSFLTSPTGSVATGALLAPQPVIQETDAAGNALTSDSTCIVTLALAGAVETGDQFTGSTISKTMISGVADFSGQNLKVIRSGKTSGARTYHLTATGSGSCVGLGAAVSTDFSVTLAQVPSQLVVVQAPGPSSLNVTWAQQPIVSVLDMNGDPVTSDNTTVVTMTITSFVPAVAGCPTSGILLGNTSIPVSGGKANFGGLSVPATAAQACFAGTYTYTFTATHSPLPALTSTTSTHFIDQNGLVPAKLSFKTQPPNAARNQTTLSFQAQTTDANGNFCAFDNTTVISVHGFFLSGGVGAKLTCPNLLKNGGGDFVTTVINGIATFNNCSIDTVGTYFFEVTGSQAGAPISDSSVFSISNFSNVADHLFFETQPLRLTTPGNVDPGGAPAPFGTQPIVGVHDQFENLITSDNTTIVTVDCIIPLDCGTIIGTNSQRVTSGKASFTGLEVGSGNNGKTIQLKATSTPVMPVQPRNSNTFGD